MKKIIYFLILILLLTFKDALYSKTQFECVDMLGCTDVIEIRKHGWSFFGPLYFYNDKKLGEYQIKDIFNCLNNDQVNRFYGSSNFWIKVASISAIFYAIGTGTNIGLAIAGIYNVASWSTTVGFGVLGILSIPISSYYKKQAVETYNRIIIENKNIIDNEISKSMKHKNVDIFSIGFSHKF